MSEELEAGQAQSGTESATDVPDQPQGPDLGDPGKRALESERRARKDAEKQVKDLQAKLTALEEKDLDAEAKAQAESERLVARVAELEARNAAAELRAIRSDAAAKAKLPAGWADRLRGETADEIEADARALAADLNAHHRGTAPPTPGQGQDSKPPSGVDAGADLFAERHGKQ